jgi:predicted RNA binding protein YcfA (HicA-like mRNA interferase family)
VRDRKRLARLRANKISVSPEELETVLLDWGFELRGGTGSHRVFRHPKLRERVSVPYRRPLKPAYVRLALDAIDRVRRFGDEHD